MIRCAICTVIALCLSSADIAVASKVRFSLETTDLAGVPLSSVVPGSDFLLRVYAEDVRDVPQGVFAAYVDLLYDAASLLVNGPIIHHDPYINGVSGDTSTSGIIDEVGGFDGFLPLGGGRYPVFSVPFTASVSGIYNFVMNSADQGNHAVLIYGDDFVVPISEIDFGSTTLTVGSENSIFPIDIKPGSDENPVNLGSKGVLLMAVLSTDDFNVSDINISTLLFGDPLLLDNNGTAVGPLRYAFEDVSDDGLLDLTLKFSLPELVDYDALGPDSIAGLLTGALWDGTLIEGIDSLRIVPAKGSGPGSPLIAAATIPEPSSFLLAAALLALLSTIARRVGRNER